MTIEEPPRTASGDLEGFDEETSFKATLDLEKKTLEAERIDPSDAVRIKERNDRIAILEAELAAPDIVNGEELVGKSSPAKKVVPSAEKYFGIGKGLKGLRKRSGMLARAAAFFIFGLFTATEVLANKLGASMNPDIVSRKSGEVSHAPSKAGGGGHKKANPHH